MKVSTKGRYALRLMLDLALCEPGVSISLKSIGKRQEISIKYLEQIVNILNKGGFLKSVRGPMGGYSLLKKPEEYTVGSILRCIEGSLSPVACLENEVNDCQRKDICATLYLWERIEKAVDDVVDNMTLKELVDRHKSLVGND
ncbi:MAG: RrF2 family transcriptional regulator [Clostridiales bacterium]|nr:RrF2 family transcriptional regulator [Clostridiales bacterium]